MDQADGSFQAPTFATSSPWIDQGVSELETVCGDEAARVPVVPAKDAAVRVRVVLGRGARIAGRLLLPGGGAADGATVSVARSEEGDASNVAWRNARADAEGRFVIGPLVPGRYLATIEAGERAPRRVVAIETRAGETTELDQMLGGGTIRLSVLDADGAPAADVEGVLLHLDGKPAFVRSSMSSSESRLGTTSEDGTLSSVPIDPGVYRVSVAPRSSQGRRPAPVEVEVKAGETSEVLIRLER